MTSWDHDTTMIASSIELLAIAEDTVPEQMEYKSRMSGSGSSLTGWGTAKTRQSCKMNLCSLAGNNPSGAASEAQQRIRPTERMVVLPTKGEQSWGFFDSDFGGRGC